MLGLNYETGIYNDHPPGRWPLHLGRPVRTGFFTLYQVCATPYVAPVTNDPEVFEDAMEQGREVCDRCAAWLQDGLPTLTP